MKTHLTALFSTIFLCCKGIAQQPEQVKLIPHDSTAIDTSTYIFSKVEIEASFKGGDEAWRKFLERNVNAMVATDNGAPDGHYTVIVQFVVDKQGAISDIKALTTHGYGMEKEVIRVIRIGPRWSPAMQDGRPVRAYRKQPVTFVVTTEKKKKKKKD